VWARAADPAEVERQFKVLIDGVKRPGIEVKVQEDKTVPTGTGNARALAYAIFAPGAPVSFAFIMITAEHPGGGFQAELQVATAKGTPE